MNGIKLIYNDWKLQSVINKICLTESESPVREAYCSKIVFIIEASINHTGGDSSNKGCFGRKTNLFRESGDFAGNRETWEFFREI